MKAMDIAAALKSGLFDERPCSCGQCQPREHLTIATKAPLLLDLPSGDAQSFFETRASYVKVTLLYHYKRASRHLSASWQLHNAESELIDASSPHPVSQVLVPISQRGEERLLGLLGVMRFVIESARRSRVA